MFQAIRGAANSSRSKMELRRWSALQQQLQPLQQQNRSTTLSSSLSVAATTNATNPVTITTKSQQQKRGMAFQKSFHYDTPINNADTHFDFTEENYERVNHILGKYPTNYKRAAMIPLLDLAQRQAGGWLPLAAMHKVAQICEVPPVRVYEVASFYTMFNRNPVGKYFIQLCGTTPCMICGSEEIKHTIEKHLGIKEGQTTADGMFTLLEVECLGACANAPMVQLNDDYYECLTPATTIALLEACKSPNGPPPPGKWGSLPMNGQVSCEGPKGKTSLFTIPTPKIDPKRFESGAVDPAAVKKHMAY